MSNRAKSTKFSFALPLPKISREKGLFQVGSAGEVNIFCKVLIDPEIQELPLIFAPRKEIRITIESAVYQKVDVLPILELPEAKSLFDSVMRAAYNNLVNIYNYV